MYIKLIPRMQDERQHLPINLLIHPRQKKYFPDGENWIVPQKPRNSYTISLLRGVSLKPTCPDGYECVPLLDLGVRVEIIVRERGVLGPSNVIGNTSGLLPVVKQYQDYLLINQADCVRKMSHLSKNLDMIL